MPRWIDEMGIALDRGAEVPVGVQLAWALRLAIRAGTLAPGSRLPSLRELADELGVNPNTLRSVYARLEAEDLIETRHGSGTYVAPGGGEPADLSALVAGAARAAGEAGVDLRELAAALYVNTEKPKRRNRQAQRRREVREEIAVLERALNDLYEGMAQPATRARGAKQGPHLPSLAELEQQRAGLLRRLAAAQERLDKRGTGDAGDATEPETEPAATQREPRPRLRPATA